MEVQQHGVGLGGIACLLAIASSVAAQAPDPAPAPAAKTEQQERLELMKKDAEVYYQTIETAFLNSDWEQLKILVPDALKQQRYLEAKTGAKLAGIRKDVQQMRPEWWSKCASPSNVSFKAEIWNRDFIANYIPSKELGFQGVIPEGKWVRGRKGEYEMQVTALKVMVTWKPHLIDNPQLANGALSQRLGIRLGDLGEIIAWHELGHNYITSNLPMQGVVELYQNHRELYSHLQEFYADITAVVHASPRARRVVMLLRLEGFDYYDPEESHARGSHALGSIFLNEVLERPDAWPSVVFPPSVPKQQVELNTLIYVYENWRKEWTLDEDIALRDLYRKYITTQGEKTFRRRGVIDLPSGTSFALMAAMDQAFQPKRDEWVGRKLQALIDAGRADKGEYNPPVRAKTSSRVWTKEEFEKLQRIEIPW